MDEKRIILFDTYLAGELSPTEKLSFEAELKNDSDLHKEFELYKEMNDFLDEKTSHAKALESISNVRKDFSNSQPKKTTSNWMYILFGLILFALAAYFFMSNNKSSEPDFYAHYEAPIWPNERGGSNELEKGVQLFLNGNSQEGIEKLKEISDQSPINNYWIAEMYLAEENANGCLEYLMKAGELSGKKGRVLFMKALAYYMKKDKASLDEIKNALPESLDDYYRNQIQDLSSPSY